MPRTTLPLTILALLLLCLPALGQVQNAQLGGFGTQVKVGDPDYLPLTKRASVAVRAMDADLGIPSQVTDNCVLLIGDNGDGGAARPSLVGLPQAVNNKDIRLTPCFGQAVGTPIRDADLEQTSAFVERAVEVRYGDADGNGKFGKNDAVFLTTKTGASRGLAASTAPGAWTLRITPSAGFPAGSFVYPGDADFVQFGALATGATPPAGSPAARTFSLAEREGNGWYVLAAAVGYAAQQAIPVNSVRIGLVGVGTLQPDVKPVAVAVLDPDGLEAGKPFAVSVTVANAGTSTGQGLLVTRLGSTLVDARLTPVLGVGETTTLVITVPAQPAGGSFPLEVNDAFQIVHLAGAAAGPDEISALRAEVQALRQQVDASDSAAAAAPAAGVAPAAVHVERQGAPGVPLAALLVGLALAVAARARGPQRPQ
jgi:hypothetical protein